MANSVVPSEFAVSYRLNHTDRQWTEQQYLKRNIDLVVNRNIRELIASNEELHQNRSEMLRTMAGGIQDSLGAANENLEVLSLQLDEIIGSLDVLNQNVVSGFQALFVEAAEINASLAHLSRQVDTLIDIARTPVQTWALNQYEIARDSCRRKLFPEAIEALDFAINGNGSNPGYKTDHRFHQLKGTLRLGIDGEPETAALVDLRDAENSFTLAVRYARQDDRTAAAQASVGAGKAAWRLSKLTDAERHFLAALEFDLDCGEAHYQLARFYMEQGKPVDVERHLLKAFDLHWSFAMRAAADVLFIKNSEIVERCVRSLAERITKDVKPRIDQMISSAKALKGLEDGTYTVDLTPTYENLVAEIRTSAERVRSQRLKSLHELRSKISVLSELPYKASSDYVEYIEARMSTIIGRGEKAVPTGDPEERASNLGTIVGGTIISAVVVIFLISLVSLVAKEPMAQGSALGFVFTLIFTAILSIPLLVIVGLLGAGGAALAGWLTYVGVKQSMQAEKERAVSENRRLAEKNGAAIQERLNKLRRLCADLKPARPPVDRTGAVAD